MVYQLVLNKSRTISRASGLLILSSFLLFAVGLHYNQIPDQIYLVLKYESN